MYGNERWEDNEKKLPSVSSAPPMAQDIEVTVRVKGVAALPKAEKVSNKPKDGYAADGSVLPQWA